MAHKGYGKSLLQKQWGPNDVPSVLWSRVWDTGPSWGVEADIELPV